MARNAATEPNVRRGSSRPPLATFVKPLRRERQIPRGMAETKHVTAIFQLPTARIGIVEAEGFVPDIEFQRRPGSRFEIDATEALQLLLDPEDLRVPAADVELHDRGSAVGPGIAHVDMAPEAVVRADESQIGELEAQKSAAERMREEMRNAKAQLETQKEALDADIAAKTDELNQLKAQVSNWGSQVEGLSGQIETAVACSGQGPLPPGVMERLPALWASDFKG